MGKSCPAIPSQVLPIFNQAAKDLKARGMSSQDARKVAANLMLESIDEVFGSQEFNDHGYTAGAKEVIDQQNFSNLYWGYKSLVPTNQRDYAHSKYLDTLLTDYFGKLNQNLVGYTVQTGTTTNSTFGKVDTANKTVDIYVNHSPATTGLDLHPEEVFLHEATHITTANLLNSAPFFIKQGIMKLYNEAREVLTPEDLLGLQPASTTSLEAAKARYDYIFSDPKKGIHEFVAFGMTNQAFRKAISDKVKLKKDVPKTHNPIKKLQQLFLALVDWIGNRALHINDKDASVALSKLVFELNGLNKKNRDILHLLSNGLMFAPRQANKAIDFIIKPIIDFGNNPKNTGKTAKTIRFIVNAPNLSKLKPLTEAISRSVGNLARERNNFFLNLLVKLPREVAGITDINSKFEALLRLSKSVIDGTAHRIKEHTITNIRRKIVGKMSDAEKEYLYQIVLKTDLSDLVTFSEGEFAYPINEFDKLLTDKSYLLKSIANEEKELSRLLQGNKVKNEFIRQTKGLGMFMVRHETFNHANQMRNATNIVEQYYKKDNRIDIPNKVEVVNLIERLKVLYSLTYTTEPARQSVSTMLTTQKDAFETILALHAQYKEDSKKDFENNPTSIEAGYTSEILRPDIAIEYSMNPNDKSLLDRGFVKEKYALKGSRYDKGVNAPIYVYTSKYNGLLPYIKSIVSLTDKHRAGTTIYDRLIASGESGYSAAFMAANEVKAITSRVNQFGKFGDLKGLDESDTSNLVPILDSQGNIIEYSYVMTEENRQRIFSKNTKVDMVLATMFEHASNRRETPPLNKKVVEALKEDYDKYHTKYPKDFEVITKDHPNYGDLYKLLPQEMKYELDKVFGEGQIIIRRQLVDIVLGFRKHSIIDAQFKSKFLKMLKDFYVAFGGSQGGFLTKGRAIEQGFQEFIAEIKTTIVLKTKVLIGNITSNMIVSLMYGMPPDYMFKKQAEAIQALNKYTDSFREKTIAEQDLKKFNLDDESKAKLQKRIKAYKYELDNSPIKTLVDAGLLNSIVEDIDSDDDNQWGFKSAITDYIADKTKAIPAPIKSAYEWAQIGKRTSLYKFFEKTTRYSDFVARYSLHEFLINEKKVPEADALKTVIEQFINYDMPTSKELQYLNDMGFIAFTKYALRIQKMILKVAYNNPKSLVYLYTMENLLGQNMSDPTDSFFHIPGGIVNDAEVLIAPGINLVTDLLGF